MSATTPLSELLTLKQLRTLVSSFKKAQLCQQNRAQLSEELFVKILDRYPDPKTLRKIHSKIIVDGNINSSPPLRIKLMKAYAACGEPAVARHLFDEMPQKNVMFYNVMIKSYVKNHLYQDALLVYKAMSCNGFRPDNYTYSCVLKACSGPGGLEVGLQIHGVVLKVGHHLKLFIGNGLAAMYGKCGCLVEARRVFDEIPGRDVVKYWNSLVARYAQNGRFDDALRCCWEMESLGLNPDAHTMASLLPAVTNTSLENVLYVKDMFTKLAKKNVLSWNVMISVYVKNSMPAEAVDLFINMEALGFEPNAMTISSVLSACGDLSAQSLGRRIHMYVEKKKLQTDLALENALVNMYAKCGCLREARAVFDQMQHRDVVSWTLLISAYVRRRKHREAVDLFMKMQKSGLNPDSVAFLSVLSACRLAGLVDEAQLLFKLMVNEYKIVPWMSHFAIMVGLLGSAGKVDEAYGIIKEMPITPDELVWGNLLRACQAYSNMDIGLVAADNLLKIVPKQPHYYVLLSSFYAKACRWKELNVVSTIMMKRGIKMTPGLSHVELEGRVHNPETN